MPSLQATLRHQAILTVIGERGQASVNDLSDRLGVSAVTIRQDLRDLEAERRLLRTRGGALALVDPGKEMPLEVSSKTHTAEKRAIAAAAAAHIRDGQTIIIDVGSTTSALAELLPGKRKNLTVITNGLTIALLLERHPEITVVVTGGTLRALQHALVAPLGNVLLQHVNADIAFIGCNGIDVRRGITNSNIAEAEIKQAMLAAARRTVVLADHSKIGVVSTAFVANPASVDRVITDEAADSKTVARLRETGLAIELVKRAMVDAVAD
ncbi:DeoR/GlpR family DNA-binding transcription regulator [Consotaella salsifontis]|uniref:Transcriptional regulator, DeoR family n=1 Tax=Consotaella salsifontis TaxID=1365950 RepID=A0A1T4SMT0_9HYPH|nr:DeoR/GlpR family DNA-binding transcription regulator [Consotaella salsifontis]SKA29485.1 transcriptional regulator, DeoR family [Consotaella salsifontis]